MLTTTSWRAHGRDEDQVLQSLEGFVFIDAVIPTVVVHELADELDGWHGAELFFHGHVQVINEDDELLADGWAVDTLAVLVELGIHEVLHLVRRCLGREGHL